MGARGHQGNDGQYGHAEYAMDAVIQTNMKTCLSAGILRTSAPSTLFWMNVASYDSYALIVTVYILSRPVSHHALPPRLKERMFWGVQSPLALLRDRTKPWCGSGAKPLNQ
jgi:hypothetical protein